MDGGVAVVAVVVCVPGKPSKRAVRPRRGAGQLLELNAQLVPYPHAVPRLVGHNAFPF